MGRRQERIKRKRSSREAREERERKENRIRAEAIGRDRLRWYGLENMPDGLQGSALVGAAAAVFMVMLPQDAATFLLRFGLWTSAFASGLVFWLIARRRASRRLQLFCACILAIWAAVGSVLF